MPNSFENLKYPEAIRILVGEVIEVLKTKDVVSIMALGSLPRGELTYTIKEARATIFSDLDILIIKQDAVSDETRRAFKEPLKKIKRKYQPSNPLFDINIEIISLRELKKLPFKVRFYELKESGCVLFGEDLRYLIPEFRADRLSITDTNNIILRRLLAILLYLPRQILEENKPESAQVVLKYMLARNSLDIATVLLFRKGIYLPTYNERVQYINSKAADFVKEFDADFPNFLKKCLTIKLEADFNISPADLFDDAIKYFKLAIGYLLEEEMGLRYKEKGLLCLIDRPKKDMFGEADISRAKLSFVTKSPGLDLLFKRVKALSHSFLGCIIFYLFNMNNSASLFVKADKNSLRALDDSWWALMKLGILTGEESLPVNFIDRFLALREKFFDFYVKFLDPELEEHVREILNWKYE